MYKKTFVFKDKKTYKRFIDKIGNIKLYDNKYERDMINACNTAIKELNDFIRSSGNSKDANNAIFAREHIKDKMKYGGPNKTSVVLSSIRDYMPKRYLDTYEVAEIYRELVNDLQVIKKQSREARI